MSSFLVGDGDPGWFEELLKFAFRNFVGAANEDRLSGVGGED